MKNSLLIIALLITATAYSQSEESKLTKAMSNFHQALVSKNTDLISHSTDPLVTYGHSNGWIENRADLMNDLATGIISYQSFKEDSIKVNISGTTAHIRFIADINSTLRGNASTNHIKVLECKE